MPKKTNQKLKALVLAGGRGKRVNEASKAKNKCMLNFNNHPLIEYSLKNAVNAGGIAEIILVVGYRAESIINYFGNLYKQIPIRYVIQQEQKGLVHAIECAREAIDAADFMLFLSDEILVNPNHKKMIEYFCSNNFTVVCGIIKTNNPENISKTYTVIQDEYCSIFRLIEKPKRALPGNNLMGTGNCLFKNIIFDYVKETPINQKRGEKELVDLIQCVIDDGHSVKSFQICNEYININTEKDINKFRNF